MKANDTDVVVSGSVKVSSGYIGFGTGHKSEKSGSVSLHQDERGIWKGTINYIVQKGMGLRFTIGKGGQDLKLTNVSINNGSGNLFIEFHDGSFIRIAHVGDDKEAKRMKTMLENIKDGKQTSKRPFSSFSQVRQPTTSGVDTSSTVCTPDKTSTANLTLRAGNTPGRPSTLNKSLGEGRTLGKPPMVNGNTSPTASWETLGDVTEEKTGEKSIYFDTSTQQTAQKSTSSRFLANGIHKAQTTSSFYGNKETTTRNYGSSANKDNMKKLSRVFNVRKFTATPVKRNVSVTPARRPLIPPGASPRKPGMLDSSKQSRWGEKSERNKQLQLQGFSNLGNTCYMNAILQSLFALSTFSADLSTLCRELSRGPDIDEDSLYWNLGLLLKLQKEKGVIDAESQDQQRMCLNRIKGAISNSAKRFSGHQQHDAHEFLGQVLDQLKEEVDKLNKDIDDKSEAVDHNPNPNPTTKNFEFQVLHTITCTECGNKVEKTEMCNDLSITLPRRRDKARIRLQDMLDVYFRSEDIEYSCEQCSANSATVNHMFSKLPRILILHLKRYSFHRSSTTNTKTAQEVDIHRYLTLRSQCTTNTEDPTPASPRTFSQIHHLKDMERKVKQKQNLASTTSETERNGHLSENPRTVLGKETSKASPSSSSKFSFRRTKEPLGRSDLNGAQNSDNIINTDNTWLNTSGPSETEEISDEDMLKCVEEGKEVVKEAGGKKEEEDERMNEVLERSTLRAPEGCGGEAQTLQEYTEAQTAAGEDGDLPLIHIGAALTNVGDFTLQHLTEQEQFELAIQESLKDAEVAGVGNHDDHRNKQGAESEPIVNSDLNSDEASLTTDRSPDAQENRQQEGDAVDTVELFADENDADLYSNHGDSNHREGMLQCVDGTWDDDVALDNNSSIATEVGCVVDRNHGHNQSACDSDVIGQKTWPLETSSDSIGSHSRDINPWMSLDGTCDLPSDGEPESPIPAAATGSRQRSTSTPLGLKRVHSDNNSPNKLSRSGKKSRRTLYTESERTVYSPRKDSTVKFCQTPSKTFAKTSSSKEVSAERKRFQKNTDKVEDNAVSDESGKCEIWYDCEENIINGHHGNIDVNDSDSRSPTTMSSSVEDGESVEFKRDKSEQCYKRSGMIAQHRSVSDSNLCDQVAHNVPQDMDYDYDDDHDDQGANIGADIKREEHLNDPKNNIKKEVYDMLKGNEKLKPFLDKTNDDRVTADKENRTPPRDDSALNLSYTYPRRREDEEEDMQRALDISLQEQQHRNRADDCIPSGMSEEDALKAAIDASLQEVSTNVTLSESDFDEMYSDEQSYKVSRSEEEEEKVSRNTQTGTLEHSYKVISVVSHLGMSSKYGHYVSDAYDFLSHNWLSYDDTKVRPTKESDMMHDRAGTGYIFFYASKELIEQLEDQLETSDS